MNRDVKFRIWNKKTKLWIHGPGREVDLFGECILLGGLMKDTSIKDLDELVALQFTSLKDKSGKEIYEGDVVSCFVDYSKYEGDTDSFSYKEAVVYEGAGFCLKKKEFRLTLFIQKTLRLSVILLIIQNFYNYELISKGDGYVSNCFSSLYIYSPFSSCLR